MVAANLSVVSLLADMGNGEVLDAPNDLPKVNGLDDPVSTTNRIIRWDAEWHWDATAFQYPHQALGGHVVALGLTNAVQIWEEYTSPIFQWAHAQGAVAGLAHFQFLPNNTFPTTLNCCLPIEYPVEVALGECDFISQDGAGADSAMLAYYRLLNCGFRPGWAGGSDWPCLAALGETRTYVQVDGALTYRKWIDGMAAGRTVVSRNGDREFLELTVNTNATPGDEVFLTGPGSVQVNVDWTVGQSLSGQLQIVKNGVVVASKPASASPGNPDSLGATVIFTNSGWVVARRMSGAGHEVHTGAIYVTVDSQPVRASIEDAQFYVDWMDQLLQRTAANGVWASYFVTNRTEARARYQAARDIYQQIATEAAAAQPLAIVTSVLPGAITNLPYNAFLQAAGGTTPYTWSITNGLLPAGLSLDTNSGVISGTTVATGAFNFTVEVADSDAPIQTASRPLSLTVGTSVGDPGLIGNTNSGTLTDAIWFNGAYINAGRHLAASNMTVATIYAQVKGIAGAYKCALYTDNGAQPDQLLASTAEVVGPGTGWQAFPLSGTVTLTNGNYYWLAVWSDDANAEVYYSDSSGTLRWEQYDFGAWPNPLSTSDSGTFNYCIYASGFPPSSPAPLALVSTSPPDGAVEVQSLATVEAVFNRAMSVATINTNTVMLFDGGSNLVPASVAYDAPSFSAVLTPSAPLTASSAYTARILGGLGGVADTFGGTLSNDVSWAFITAAPDTNAPFVRLTNPDAGMNGGNIAGALTIVFSEPVDPATISSATVSLRDGASALVPSRVSYSSSRLTASLIPDGLLDKNSLYTATVAGGGAGVKDLAGNAMSSDYVWSFTTVSADPYGGGPGGPLLVLTNPTNAFSTYYAEILLAEGLNLFELRDIGTVSNGLLANFDVAILGDFDVSPAQAGMLSNWVLGGGRLVAMRPDQKLAGLLGLTDVGATLAEGYILADGSTGAGVGITAETMQYHGTADLYTPAGATVLATLYSNAVTASGHPAVTLRDVGPNGGQAAAFTYDLARSIVLTRQGNPAWADQDRDGTGVVRSDDLFYGNAAGDPQPDWVDTGKLGIPQADEQQRLFMNLITEMTEGGQPLPRFWYFPNGHRAAIIMTGDDHANGYTDDRFDQYLAYSPTNASVAEWQAVRGSSYIYPNTPISDSQAAQYVADGFEIGLHVNTGCAGYTSGSLDSLISSQLTAFRSAFPSLPSPTTHRVHCIAWSGYTVLPEVQFDYGIRFDVNYYHYPPSWIGGIPGFMTGSGMPMRFCTSTGSPINVYQGATQLTDESGQIYPDTVDYLLDRALGPEGYYGAFTANIHTDFPDTDPESDAIILSAAQRGVPVITAEQMLTWVDGRNGSSITNLAWTNDVLAFSVAANANAFGLQTMVPVRLGSMVSSVTSNASASVYQLRHVKGIQYAQIPVDDGSFEVSFIPDSLAPSVVGTSPHQGETGVSTTKSLSVRFSEAMAPATLNTNTIVVTDALSNPVDCTVAYNGYTLEAILTPTAPLLESSLYAVTLMGGGSGVRDLAGNALSQDYQWIFTTVPEEPVTLWPPSATPALLADPDDTATEVGVKFQASQDGYILGIRFYKGPFNSGSHQGNLWTAGAANLASVTFSAETSAGWQEQLFASPVAISSNTTYVASYHAPNGRYSVSPSYFASSGYTNGPLRALANGEQGGNGVFKYGVSGFPDETNESENYWVDVLFVRTVVSNTPPVFVATPANTMISELTPLSVTNNAVDAEAPPQVLSYSLLAGPTNAVIDTNGVIGWTPLEGQGPSTNTFVTVVDDGQVSATNSFVVTVSETNAAPVFDGTPLDVELVELTLWSVTNSASDGDIPVQVLSYQLIGAPGGAAIDPEGVITWTPGEGQAPSTNTFTTVVDDGQAGVTNSFVVTVSEINAAPVFDGVPVNVEIVELTLLSVTNAASDTDLPEQVLSYSLLSGPTNAVIDTNGVISWTPLESQGPSTNAFVTVVDDGQASATNSFVVTVSETNAAPVFDGTPLDVELVELTLLSVTNAASDGDVPMQTLSYALLAAPTNAVIDTNGVISWTPGEADGPSTNTFVTEVSDGVVSVTNSFVVTVAETNAAPVFDGTPLDVELVELTLLSVTNAASDGDVPMQTLSYALLAAPTNAVIDTNGVISWTPGEADGPSTNSFVTEVSDGVVSVTNSFVVIVYDANVPLEILGLTIEDDVASVLWSAIPGQNYFLEYVDVLDDTNWIQLAPSVQAEATTAAATNDLSGVPQRFYRIRLGGD